MTTQLRSERGVTIVEATVVLMIAAVLVGALAPATSRTLNASKLTAAQADLDAIAVGIDTFLDEFTVFTRPFTSTGASGGATVQMLVSDGDIAPVAFGAGAEWDDPVGTSPTIVDFLERHLVTNTPIGGGSYTAGGTTGWRGAYLNGPIDPDPWGNRYAVNTLYLRTSTTNDVFALSSGPDEQIDSLFTVNGAYPASDDLIAVIRRDAGNLFTVP